MAASPPLNARNLEKLGATALAELLIEVATGHATIKRRLRLALADLSGPEAIAAQIRKRLATVAKARSALDWRQLRALAADLATQHAAITGPLAAADPAGAHDLLWHFLTLADRLYARTDDGGGRLHDLFAAAAADLAPLAQAARVTPAALIDRMVDALTGPQHGQHDGLVAVLAPLIGRDGLDRLAARIVAWRDTVSNGDAPAAARAAGRRSEAARTVLERIADAAGDTDAWIALQPAPVRRRPAVAAEIARRLLADGRAADAWAAIDAADTGRLAYVPPAWDMVRLEALDALGRTAEAQAWRWQRFEQALHADHLRDHLRRLPDFDDFEAEQRALGLAETFADVHAALAFLIAWPAPDRAARMTLARAKELDGDRYEVLSEAADRLDAAHPLAATVLRRAMIDFALRTGRSARYAHAGRHLTDCAAADARIADHRGLPDHATYAAALSRAHDRKTGFWRAAGL